MWSSHTVLSNIITATGLQGQTPGSGAAHIGSTGTLLMRMANPQGLGYEAAAAQEREEQPQTQYGAWPPVVADSAGAEQPLPELPPDLFETAKAAMLRHMEDARASGAWRRSEVPDSGRRWLMPPADDGSSLSCGPWRPEHNQSLILMALGEMLPDGEHAALIAMDALLVAMGGDAWEAYTQDDLAMQLVWRLWPSCSSDSPDEVTFFYCSSEHVRKTAQAAVRGDMMFANRARAVEAAARVRTPAFWMPTTGSNAQDPRTAMLQQVLVENLADGEAEDDLAVA